MSQAKEAACAKARGERKLGVLRMAQGLAGPGLQDDSGSRAPMDPLTMKGCMNPSSLSHSSVAPGGFEDSPPWRLTAWPCSQQTRV